MMQSSLRVPFLIQLVAIVNGIHVWATNSELILVWAPPRDKCKSAKGYCQWETWLLLNQPFWGGNHKLVAKIVQRFYKQANPVVEFLHLATNISVQSSCGIVHCWQISKCFHCGHYSQSSSMSNFDFSPRSTTANHDDPLLSSIHEDQLTTFKPPYKPKSATTNHDAPLFPTTNREKAILTGTNHINIKINHYQR